MSTEPAVDPAKVEPAVDPAKTEPVKTEPAVDPVKTEPAVDPVKADPAKTEPAKTEPAVDPAKEPAKDVAPEKYEFKAPEGQELDSEVTSAFADVAKELGLPQDKAQKVIDKVAPVLDARNKAAVEQMRNSLLEAAKADKEIGGDNFGESVQVAKLAIEAYFAPEFAKFLNDTGLGNHPEMIRGLRKAGMSLKQDGWIPGVNGPKASDGAQSFYDKSNMQP